MSFIKWLSSMAIPFFIFIVLAYGYVKDIDVYDTFIEGAAEGISTVIKVLPYLVAMFVAISIFRASGAMDMLVGFLSPITSFLGIPAEVMPLAIMRPMSGAASTGMLAELLNEYGPDSFIGRVASTMAGSTETIFYTLSVYFGSIGIRKTRHTVWAALLADLAGIIASVFICNLVFGT
ncbi:MAG: spore maturation protein [Xylanivirga thermophila]|uniref:spore maturation protein n=1 Tax=Xylanivirga thermophila TaxID=2496273 RepID=UPI00101B855A|nr:spore maturation protein [Xylanivirga thermophila]